MPAPRVAEEEELPLCTDALLEARHGDGIGAGHFVWLKSALIVLLMRLDWRRILPGRLPATSEQSRSLDDQEMGDGHADDPRA